MSEPLAGAAMVLGPVFHAELVATSRRRRYYVARLAYGLSLLGMVGLVYQEEASRLGRATRPDLAMTAALLASAFLTTQVSAVLCLTPAMVAGAIADERQRKTLHYLLASRLTGGEIVLGKLGARLLQLVVLVLTGLPILSMLSLFGGLDPPLIVAAFAGTLTTAFLVAGLAILVSVHARRARDAIVTTYILLGLALAAPTIVGLVLAPTSPRTLGAFLRVASPLRYLDPFAIGELARPGSGLLARLATMMGLQVTLGSAMVGLAVWRLRPASAGGERARAAESWARRPSGSVPASRARSVASRLFGRPTVGDDPMAWKERHIARLGPVLRAFGLLASVFAVVFLGDILLELGRPAFAEVLRYGYGDAPGLVVHKARDELNGPLALAATLAASVWFVGLAATTASGIPSEREEDTWISLLATPLDGAEIVRGKAVGALWRWRFAGGAAVALWTFGLVAGAIHPLGFAMTILLFATYTAFALALGTFASLWSRSTARATVATLATLFVLDGGYLMCLAPFAGSLDELWLAAPVMPYVLDLAPARYAPVQALFGTYPMDVYRLRIDGIVSPLLCALVSLVGYGVAAAVLGGLAVDSFDRLADRPRRPPGFSAALAEAIALEAEAEAEAAPPG